LDVTMYSSISGASVVDTPLYLLKAESYPYIVLNVEEFGSNDHGSDNVLDRSFAVLQPDNSFGQLNDGSDRFNVFVPKFLKCQRVFHPNPLSNLFKLTINMLRPNGSLVSNTQDAYDIAGVLGSDAATFSTSRFYTSAAPPKFFMIQTKSYFNSSLFATSDIIQIAGFAYEDATYVTYPGLRDFAAWMNEPMGHQVMGVGYYDGGGTYHDGPNNVGYGNVIIIRARMQDPSTGSTSVDPFSSVGASITDDLDDMAVITSLIVPCRLLNMMHQTQLIFRVITKEKDAVSELRPDNI
jgi:hypothetical protein